MAEEKKGYVELPNSWSGDSLNDQRRMFKELYDGVDEATELAGEGLKENSVGTPELKDKAVTGDKLAEKTVTTEKLADRSIGTEKIKINSVDETIIKNNSITKDKLTNKSVTPEKSVALNTHAIVLFDGSNQYANFDKANKKLNIPQGGLRFKNTTYSFTKHTIDATLPMSKGSYLTLFFNTVNKTFELLSNPELPNVSFDSILVCVIDLSQNRVFGTVLPITIDEKNTEPIKFGNFQTMFLSGFDEDVLFDWENNEIIIPAVTNAVIQGEYLTRPDLTQGNVVKVPMSVTAKEQVLVFDKTTKKFRVIDYNKVSTDFFINDVMIAIFSSNYKKVVGSLNYRTSDESSSGGNQKYQSNTLFTTFNDYINFDFDNMKIELPALSYLIDGNIIITASDLTQGIKRTISIPNNDNKSFLLVWNKTTKTYEFIIFNEIKTKLTENKVVIAYFSITYKKVVMVNGVPFKINGFLFDDKNNYIIPEHFRDEIQRLYEDVQKLKSIDTFTFAFITDIHNELGHIYNFVEFCNRGLVDVAVNGGDTIIVEMVEYLAINHFKKYHDAFSQLKVPYYGIRGNHDASVPPPYDVYTEGMMSTEFANRMIYNYPLSKYNERTKNGYYFVDDDERKIRMIYTNSCEGKTNDFYRWDWSNEQLKWIAEKALNMTGKEDYHVVVFGHINPLQKFSFTVNPNNGEPLLEMLQSFKNGTTYQNSSANINIDFKNSHTLIGFIFGHTHQDALDTTNHYGINLISTVSSLPDYYPKPTGETGVNKSWERQKDTKNEDGWDVFIVNSETRNVKIRRFGAGENREFNY